MYNMCAVVDILGSFALVDIVALSAYDYMWHACDYLERTGDSVRAATKKRRNTNMHEPRDDDTRKAN